MAKRITEIYSDEPHKELHSGKFGKFSRHKFSGTNERNFNIVGLKPELDLNPTDWEKLGKPCKVRVTITAVE
jgi:hypothetical protein